MGPGEIYSPLRLAFSNVTYIIKKQLIAAPTASQLRSLASGDYVVIQPPPSKCDPFGQRWANNLIYLPFDALAGINAARALAQWELTAQIAPEKRRSTPLFCGPAGPGSSLTHAQLDSIFQRLLRWILTDEKEARWYSIHSFRAYLANALLASGRSDAQIQVALRWATSEALQVYKTTNIEEYGSWLLTAEQQVVSGLRARALPTVQTTQLDHIDRAMAMLDADSDLRLQARAADTELAAGVPTSHDGETADYDLHSWT